MSTYELAFAVFIETALPRDSLVVAVNHVYVDESNTHDGARVMGVSGYIFEANQAVRFSRDWAKCLQRFGLPFAHMSDCAHGTGSYKNLSLAERVDTERKLIENIKRRSKVGISVLVDPRLYDRTFADDSRMPSAYSFCMMAFVNAVIRWSNKNAPSTKISYFFEAGHTHQSEANLYMNDLPRSPQARDSYLSHSFFKKTDAPPLQAADMLAWQSTHYFERQIDGHKIVRKDFAALIRKGDYFNFYGLDDLETLRPILASDLSAGI